MGKDNNFAQKNVQKFVFRCMYTQSILTMRFYAASVSLMSQIHWVYESGPIKSTLDFHVMLW